MAQKQQNTSKRENTIHCRITPITINNATYMNENIKQILFEILITNKHLL